MFFFRQVVEKKYNEVKEFLMVFFFFFNFFVCFVLLCFFGCTLRIFRQKVT